MPQSVRRMTRFGWFMRNMSRQRSPGGRRMRITIELRERREEDDLRDGQLRPEALDDGIGPGKQRVGQESEGDALQHGITGEESHLTRNPAPAGGLR